MKSFEEKYTFEWFKRFFYPVVDLDEGKPDDPEYRAKLCWEHFVKPYIKERDRYVVGEDEAPGDKWINTLKQPTWAIRDTLREEQRKRAEETL